MVESFITSRCAFVCHSFFKSAKGNIVKAPPRFRQKINVGTGMVLSAIIGPELPIPIIPSESSAISRPSGSLVW